MESPGKEPPSSSKIRSKNEFNLFLKRDSNLSTTSISLISKSLNQRGRTIKHRLSIEDGESFQARDPSQIAFNKFKSTFLKKKAGATSQHFISDLDSIPRTILKSAISREIPSFKALPDPDRFTRMEKEDSSTPSVMNATNFPAIRSFDDEPREEENSSARNLRSKRHKKKLNSGKFSESEQEQEFEVPEPVAATKENNEKVERILLILHRLIIHYKGLELAKLGIDLEGSFGEILTLTSQLRLPKFQLKTLECYGKLLLLIGNYRRALRIFRNHRNLSILINDSKEKLTSYFFISITYSIINENEKALIFLKKMLKTSWKMNDNSNELRCYDIIGLIYYKMGLLNKSSFFHELMIRGDCVEKDVWFRKLAEESIDIKRKLKLHNYIHQIVFEEFSYAQLTKDSQAVQSILTDSEDDFDLDMFMRENKYNAERKNLLPAHKKATLKHENLLKIHLQRHTGKSLSETSKLGPSSSRSPVFQKHSTAIDNQPLRWNTMINHMSGNRNLSTYLVTTYSNPIAYEFADYIQKDFDTIDKKKLIKHLIGLKVIVEKYIEYLAEKLGISVPLTIKLGRKRGRLYSNINSFGLMKGKKNSVINFPDG